MPFRPLPSRACEAGEVVIMSLPRETFEASRSAFTSGIADASGDVITVRIECSVAQLLTFALSASIATNYEVAQDDPDGS